MTSEISTINEYSIDELAEEMMALLLKTLPDEMAQIKKSKIEKNYPDLLRHLHKLHGAVCYCGVPRLKQSIAALETILKQKKYAKLPKLFKQFEQEALLVLNESSEVEIA